MVDGQPPGWDRRKFLGGAALLAVVLGVPIAAIKLDLFEPDEEPTDRQRELLGTVSQMVIPPTETPGADDVGTGDFVLLALAHGLERSREPLPQDAGPQLMKFQRKDGSLDHAGWLEADLDLRTNGDFMKADDPARALALTTLDAEAYAEGVRTHPWRTLKALILTGYYTSEVGGSQELRFELVPGRYEPDLPITPETRAYSSDWTAVDFG
jgi:hypothetical protein